MIGSMTTFGLVNGAGTVGASWGPVSAVLQAHGHRCVMPDLPMEDREATFADYAQTVLDALADAGDDVVLVGHSMGGMVVPLVADRRPVRHCVYVAAMVPVPGRSLRDLMREEPMVTPEASAAMVRGEDGLIHWEHDGAVELLFDEVSPQQAERSFASMRGHAVAPYREPCPLAALPAVTATYVACAADRVIDPGWGLAVAAPRLAATATTLPGGHMPMLVRPRELAGVLETATA